jgi:hypothetical protein
VAPNLIPHLPDKGQGLSPSILRLPCLKQPIDSFLFNWLISSLRVFNSQLSRVQTFEASLTFLSGGFQLNQARAGGQSQSCFFSPWPSRHSPIAILYSRRSCLTTFVSWFLLTNVFILGEKIQNQLYRSLPHTSWVTWRRHGLSYFGSFTLTISCPNLQKNLPSHFDIF